MQCITLHLSKHDTSSLQEIYFTAR